MDARRLLPCCRGLGLVLAGIALLAAPATGGAAPASKVITVRPETLIHMTGSDIYCTVIKESVGPVVACFHDPGGPSSSRRRGYAIAAADAFAVVEPPASNVPIKTKTQPSLKNVPVFSGGSAPKKILELGLDDLAAVGGTHMAVLVTTAKGGGNAIGVVYLDGKDNPIVGTFTAGISNHYVSIVRVVSPSKTSVAYRHSVY